MPFQFCKSRDRAQHELIIPYSEGAANLIATPTRMKKRGGLHAGVHRFVLLRAADSHGKRLISHRVGDAEYPVTSASGVTLAGNVDRVPPLLLVRMKRQAMNGVDDRRDALFPGGHAPDDACLGRMRVHNIRLPVANQAAQIVVATPVLDQREFAHEARRFDGLDAATIRVEITNALKQRTLRPVDRPKDERHGVTLSHLPFARKNGVFL